MRNSKKTERIENLVMGAAAALAAAVLIIAASALAGCAVNPDTGATELFGCIEVSDATLDVAEAAAHEASGAGGIVGALGVLAGAAIAVYRRRRRPSSAKAEEELKSL